MAAAGSLGLLQAPSSFTAAVASRPAARRAPRALFAVRASAADATKDAVLKAFREKRALKIISGLQNFDRSSVASVVSAADKGGATHIDIACDQDLVKLALELTSLPICVSSVDPSAFHSAVEAGAKMIEIGNYDSFYDTGIEFSSEKILKLTRETREMLPDITLSVTVPHTLSLPDQVRLAELLEEEGADIIQTEGGKCSSPTKPGVLGLIEKATPTLAAAYSISRAVTIPVMCASGLSSVTAPMAVTAGAAGVGRQTLEPPSSFPLLLAAAAATAVKAAAAAGSHPPSATSSAAQDRWESIFPFIDANHQRSDRSLVGRNRS